MANMTFKANILPATTAQEYNLGSSTQQWNVYGPIHSNGIYGTPDVDYGSSLPASATEGQLFFQTSTTIIYSVPAGGTAGYALVKNTNADGDFSWQEVAHESYSVLAAQQNGTSASLVTTGDKYNWNNAILSVMSAGEMQGGTATTARSMSAKNIHDAIANLGGTGLTLTHNGTNGIKLDHTNSATTKTAYVDSATTANAAGGTIKVTDVKYDGQGHITTTQDRTITLGLVAGYGDTTNPYAAKTKNYVLAAPTDSNDVPSFRALTTDDLPELDIDSATTGTLPISRGGTGETLAASAWAALGGGSVGVLDLNASATTYLSGSGTWTTPPGTYVLPAATTSTLGGVMVSSTTAGLVLDDGDLSVDWTGAPVLSVNNMVGDVELQSLTIGAKHYNGTTATVIAVTDLGLASPMTFRGVTDTTLIDGQDVTPINIVSGGTIGSFTPSAGDVVLQKTEQMEYIYSGSEWTQLGIASSYSLSEHSHGYILNDGVIEATATVALNDRLLIADSSDSGRVTRSNLLFDTTSTASALSKAGSWVNYLQTAGGTMTGAVKTKGLVGTVNVDYGDVLPTTAVEGQVFFQVSYGDNEFSLPAGGTAGYALVKNSAADGDVKWALINASDRVLKAGDTMTGNLTMTAGKSVQRAGVSQSWINGRDKAIIRTTSYSGYDAIASMKTTNGAWEMGVYTSNILYFTYTPDTNYSSGTNSGYAQMHITSTGQVYGAVWNDYAEYRQSDVLEPGRVIKENGDDTLSLTTKRLERGCEIVSDTFGFAIGENDKAKTPTAASGRVLAYPYESLEEFKSHIGWPVCSGPEGTVSIMTEEEEMKYPSRIIGTISAVPDYALWLSGSGEDPIKVNGRVWIRIR